MKRSVRRRLIDKPHILRLTDGTTEYLSTIDQFLHFNFQILVNYVATEVASEHLNYKGKPSSELGLEQLYEIIECYKREDGMDTEQQKFEQLLDLYLWWTQERPARICPWTHSSIWPESHCFKDSFTSFLSSANTPELKEARRRCMDLVNFYDDEDQERLNALIKIIGGIFL
jgi:hypothetical protein